MKKVFLGFLFIIIPSISFKFGVNNQYVLEILPRFLGYIFIFYGLNEMKNWGENFNQSSKICRIIVIYTAAIWTLRLVGIDQASILSLAESFGMLYMIFKINQGFSVIEKRYGTDLNSYKLRVTWRAMFAFETISAVITLVSLLLKIENILIAGIIFIVLIADLIAYVAFLANLYQAKVNFESFLYNYVTETPQSIEEKNR